MLQLVTVHSLLGVCPFPEGAMNIESEDREKERGRDDRMKGSVNEALLLFMFLCMA